MGEFVQPFMSESIFIEGMADLFMREGKTREGTQIFNPVEGLGDKVWKAIKHIGKTIAPGNYQQMQRIWTAAHGEPNKSNIFYSWEDEITGVLDEAGKEKLIELLQEEDNLNIFLISHDFTHPLIDKISIIKDNNISSIH